MYKLIFSIAALCLAIQFNAQEVTSWKASPDLVAKLSKARTDVNYYEANVQKFDLPDPLTGTDGKKIDDPVAWEKRREEILDLFRTNVYGRIPDTKYNQQFRIIKTDNKALEGSATLKQVDIIISSGEKELAIHLNIFVPNNIKDPAPAFLLINNRGQEVADPSREKKSEFWPVEEVIERGYAIAVFNNSDIDPDNFDDFKNGIHGMLDNGNRTGDSWGTLAAWAWGASRCMDYIVTDKSIDRNRVAVIGHSRGGKTALWAGACDTRFAMVVSNESGCGGAALARRKYGETVEIINKAFPHWFCENYRKFNNNEESLPVDMHMLLSLIAPRVLYVACADEDLWGDPEGSYISIYNAVPVFRLLGKTGGIPEAMPPLNTQVTGGNIAFHIRNGGHDLLLKDWMMFVDFADKTMK